MAKMAYAQQCDTIPEMLTTLYYPHPGSYAVWDSAFGEVQKDEGFESVIQQGDNVLAVGQRVHLRGAPPSLMIVKFDQRGREMWSRFHTVSGLQRVVKILPVGQADEEGATGFVILANLKKKDKAGAFWLGFFDKDAKLISQKVIIDLPSDLIAHDITESVLGTGWIVSASKSVVMQGDEADKIKNNAIIYVLDSRGGELHKISYLLGGDSAITSVYGSKFEAGGVGYIATGWFENEFGKRNAWLLRLSEDVGLVWQKEFSRGNLAKLLYGVTDNNGHVFAFGQVDPVTDEPSASWLLALEEGGGNVLWERYYKGETGSHDYTPQGIYAQDNGLITILMGATYRAAEEHSSVEGGAEDQVDDDVLVAQDADYAHLLTLTPRGVTLSGDSYFYGKGAYIHQMVKRSDDRRIMVGSVRVLAGDVLREVARDDHTQLPPLKEPGFVDLPDAALSEQAQEGLKKLRHAIEDQDHNKEKAPQVSESAKAPVFNFDSWIVIGDAPSTYSDACK